LSAKSIIQVEITLQALGCGGKISAMFYFVRIKTGRKTVRYALAAMSDEPRAGNKSDWLELVACCGRVLTLNPKRHRFVTC
jgi:hypothetical protein